jgi:acetyl-CoA carboxylase biotin carboxyl carrier protein
LGRLPWLAALFLRAFFLRDFLAMGTTLGDGRATSAAMAASRCVIAVCDWIPSDARTPAHEGTTMAEEIRAEMVANVWKVVKAAGDDIAEGDTLVILESMKMEIPVVAESDGTVVQIAVNEGDVVQEGDLIAVVE